MAESLPFTSIFHFDGVNIRTNIHSARPYKSRDLFRSDQQFVLPITDYPVFVLFQGCAAAACDTAPAQEHQKYPNSLLPVHHIRLKRFSENTSGFTSMILQPCFAILRHPRSTGRTHSFLGDSRRTLLLRIQYFRNFGRGRNDGTEINATNLIFFQKRPNEAPFFRKNNNRFERR